MVIDKVIQTVFMGVYLPIVILSGMACWYYVTKALIPAVKGRYFNLETHAVALAAIMGLFAHFSENFYYGIGRIKTEWFDWMTNQLLVVGMMKIVILASAILFIAVYNKSRFGGPNFAKLLTLTIVLWSIGCFGAYFVELQHV